MRNFDYFAPTTISDAVQLLGQGGDQARVLAGGTDVIVQVREGRRAVQLLVDVKKIPEMTRVTWNPESGLTVGAAAPCYRLCSDANVRDHYPGLIDGAGIIGGVQIQGRASVGGNLCNASPAADSIPALIALQARCIVEGPAGRRELPVEQFCVSPGRNALHQGELLVALRLPPPPPHSGAFYLRFIPRNEMDIAVVGAGAAVTVDPQTRTFTSVRLALGAVAPTPLFLPAAGEAILGKPVAADTVALAAEVAEGEVRPITDMRGSGPQRVHLAGVLTRRALEGALRRAGVS